MNSRPFRVTVRVAVLVLALAALAALATPVAAAGSSLTVTLSPASGSPETHVVVTASGFSPGEQVEPIFDYAPPTGGIKQGHFFNFTAIGVADGSGTVHTMFMAPDVAGGVHQLTMRGLTSARVATTAYTLTPRLDTGLLIGPAGSALRLKGWAFAAHEYVRVSFDTGVVAQIKTDGHGEFAAPYTVPAAAAAGEHTLTATGVSSGFTTTTTFTVGQPQLGPNPGVDDWPSFGYNPTNSRTSPDTAAIGGSALWSTPPSGSRNAASPTVANGIVYEGTANGQVIAYDAATGSVRWTFNAAGPLYSSPTIAGGIAYVGTANYPGEGLGGNYAYGLNAATGAVIWADTMPGSTWEPPLVANGRAIFALSRKEGGTAWFIALAATTGANLWTLTVPSGQFAADSMNPTGSDLYLGTGNKCLSSAPTPNDGCSGAMLDVNAATGQVKWTQQFIDRSGDDDVASAAVYNNGFLYAGCKNGIFYKLNASTGTIVWQYDTGLGGDLGIFSSAAIFGSNVIFGSGDTYVHALNIATGVPAWSFKTGSLVISSPSLANGVLYVGSLDGKLYALDPASGALRWSHQLNGIAYGSPAIARGTLFESDGAGSIWAFH